MSKTDLAINYALEEINDLGKQVIELQAEVDFFRRQFPTAARRWKEAAQHRVQADVCLCSAYKEHNFKFYTMAGVELCEYCGTRR